MKLVRAYQKLTVKGKSETLTVINKSKFGNSAFMEMSIPFGTTGTTQTATVTMHNLPKTQQKIIVKNSYAKIEAGWISETGAYNTVTTTFEGTVSALTPSDYEVGDKTFQFSIKSGSNYDNIKEIKVKTTSKTRVVASQKTLDQAITKYNSKHNAQRKKWRDEHPNATNKEVSAYYKQIQTKKDNYAKSKRAAYLKQKKALAANKKYTKKTVYEPLSFAKNTKGSTIIKKIAKAAGIKIYSMKLVDDTKFTKGYTAKSKPMTAIKAIASKCNTPVYNSHGKLYIKQYANNKKSDLYIDYTSGLLQEPTLQDDSTSATATSEYQAVFLMRNSITGGYVFHLKSVTMDKWVLVKDGEHTIDNTQQITTCNFVDYNAYKKAQAKTEAKKKATAKKKADAAAKKKLKAKQAKRKKS